MAGKVVDSQAYKDEAMTTLGNHMDAVAAKLCAPSRDQSSDNIIGV